MAAERGFRQVFEAIPDVGGRYSALTAFGLVPAALIGVDLWRSGFSADSTIAGQTIRLGDVPFTVVGVMPDGFRFPINEQIWIPAPIPTTVTGKFW